MPGYWENPEATAEAIDDDGWMHTGDLGVMDADGYLNIVGRMKDMVIRGGENVYPREIEEVLFEHPAIGSAQVIGVPDERMGEELMAWIVVRDGATVTDDEVRAFCRERLAHFKVPRYVKVRRRVPDDRHRQDPEVPHARDRDRRARPRGGGGRPYRVTSVRGQASHKAAGCATNAPAHRGR